ncbi:uncharacterized protein PADG_06519 [Paracoccidioides brasiliensis Pb18]|uniref:Uncharacterized protein n=1 Tax=Paracoccidioides brasiliensis (strain Pb18) TaxID=502780 RepID=C1GGT2_PARBD|nr:uncharacterized protein PADG_06519 [Paracoccidioides brasiliensis Pb18]EEH50440.1 hypothetical protein PADG_06519 [Paracoccidioides brasiliensis Pb18]
MPSKKSPARLADKRPLAVDDTTDQKMAPEQDRTKRRRIAHHSSSKEKIGFPMSTTKQASTAAKSPDRKSDRKTPTKEHSRKKEKHNRNGKAPQPDDGALIVKAGDDVFTTPSTAVSERNKMNSIMDGQLSSELRKSTQWSVSRTVGGRFSDIDTVITPDEKHFILFSNTSARIFSVATSSPVRTLDVQKEIAASKLSAVNAEQHLYIATHLGAISKWDWFSGERIETWKAGHNIISMDTCSGSWGQDSANEDVIFTMSRVSSRKTEISIHVKGGSKSWESRTIREISMPASELKVAADGRVVIVIVDDQLCVGYISKLRLDSLDSIKYTWLEITLPISVTCSDIRERSPSVQVSSSKSSISSAASRVVDLALGDQSGAILIYHDILNSLLRTESRGNFGTSLVTNRLHWHRTAVKTLKWSRDGNYIISGGSETVIVQYQLDTGRKQFLPHLSSTICSVVVSPTGKFYAVRLADNSAMVLSTSELRPIASVSGLQLASQATRKDKPSGSKHVEAPQSRLPAILHPVQSEYLLAAVSSSPARSFDSPSSASSLQTFDLLTGQHVLRQALARTNVSVIQTGPQGTELTTPDIKYLGITSDGEWLSTVDEWLHYPQDVSVLYPTSITHGKEKREIFLKFWRWNESSKEWELSTRIDSPHFNTSQGSTRVLDLTASPIGSAFVTVGEDAVVRIWSPHTRYRSGQVVKDKQNQALQTWRPIHNIPLENIVHGSDPTPSKTSSLAFSDDGSVLAVCWTNQSGARMVYLINPHTGEICHTRDNLYQGTPHGVSFLDRYMVILSTQLVVWDTVADTIRLIMAVEDDKTYSPDSHPKLLSINRKSQTFAVSFASIKRKAPDEPRAEPQAKPVHHLTVFNINSLEPVFQMKLDHSCRALLPNLRTGEYILIDAAARIHRIGSGDFKQAVPRIAADVSSSLIQTDLEKIFGTYGSLERRSLPSGTGAVEPLSALRQIGFGHGRTNANAGGNLTDIFDVGPSFALPSVEVLFEGVVKHFSAKAVTA